MHKDPIFMVTGTDTDIGKTVFCAGLVQWLGAYYWKPVQAGLDDGTDSQRVAAMSGVAERYILPEAWRLKLPASPHHSADAEGVTIDTDALTIPQVDGPLVIEGAGGALVPVNHHVTYADLMARWGLPTIIVASTRLGTINHSLLTIEALRARNVPIHGIAFTGDAMPSSEGIICKMGGVKHLGRLPWLEQITPDHLGRAFDTHFNKQDFAL